MEESRMIIKKTNEEVTFSIKVIHDALHKLVYEIVENVIDELIDKVHEHLMSLIAFMHDFLYHRTKEDRRSSCCSLHAYIKAVLFISPSQPPYHFGIIHIDSEMCIFTVTRFVVWIPMMLTV